MTTKRETPSAPRSTTSSQALAERPALDAPLLAERLPKDPALSVVIPAYNAEQTILRAVESARRQLGVSLEILVIDDGSSDATADLVVAIADDRVRLLANPSKGVASARNTGINSARGDLIAFLDADDSWDPEKSLRQVRALVDNPEWVAVGTFMRYRSIKGRPLGIHGVAFRQPDLRAALVMPFPTSSLMAWSRHILAVGGFRPEFDHSWNGHAEDLDLLTRLAELGHIGLLPEALGDVYLSSSSLTATGFAAQRQATRYVRECASRRAANLPERSPDEFLCDYRLTWRQRYGDFVQLKFRQASRHAAEGATFRAASAALVATLLGPRYCIQRSTRILRGRRRHDRSHGDQVRS